MTWYCCRFLLLLFDSPPSSFPWPSLSLCDFVCGLHTQFLFLIFLVQKEPLAISQQFMLLHTKAAWQRIPRKKCIEIYRKEERSCQKRGQRCSAVTKCYFGPAEDAMSWCQWLDVGHEAKGSLNSKSQQSFKGRIEVKWGQFRWQSQRKWEMLWGTLKLNVFEIQNRK